LVVYAGKAAGVFKSIDGGANWSQVSVSGLSGHFISRLVLDSSNPVRARALDAGLDSPVVLALGFAPGPGEARAEISRSAGEHAPLFATFEPLEMRARPNRCTRRTLPPVLRPPSRDYDRWPRRAHLIFSAFSD